MKAIITFFLVFITYISHSQNVSNFEKYDELVWKAMIQYKDKNFKSSLENFNNAFRIIPNDLDYDYFYAAAAALNLNEDEEAKRLIIESIRQMNSTKSFVMNFEEFDSFRSKKIFEEIYNDYEKYQSEFIKNILNPEIYKEIDSLIEKDQLVRNNGGDMIKTDEQNINRLIEITKEYGWQKKGWLILWHQRGTYGQKNYIWSFFKPFIDKQIIEGKMRKDFWARFEDEKSIENNGKQIYGTYWSQFKDFPIEDIENVDEKRKNIGMPPLWYMKKILGIELPKEYKY